MYRVAWTSQKGLWALFGAIVSFTQEVHNAMLGLLICVVADTITGIIAAPYRGQIRNSAKLSNVVKKIITYFASALLLLVVEKLVFPTYISDGMQLARMAFGAFALIEVYSVAENLRDITGLKVFDIITMNFKKKVENSVGIEIPKGIKNEKKSS